MMISNASLRYLRSKSFLFLALVGLISQGYSQDTSADTSVSSPKDSIIEKVEVVAPSPEPKSHSPRKAAFLAGFVPGAGQIYNRKYWKLPIVYGGFGGLAYAVGINAKRYRCYNTALFAQADGDSTTTGSCNGYSDVSSLRVLKDRYKTNMDISIIGLSVWWLLTVIDAVVDAHLFEFDVGDDLSLRIEPRIGLPNGAAATYSGVRFVLRL